LIDMRRRRVLVATVLAAVTGVCGLALITAPAAQADPPVNVTSPTISGKPRVAQTLSASQGEWENNPTSFFYQWLRCNSQAANCEPIGGATQPTYLLEPPDVGSRVRVEVVAANADGSSPAKRSAATRVIRIPVPTVIAKPTVSGTPREGEILIATTGEWTGSPTSFEYSWRRCRPGAPRCETIPGAEQRTYGLGGADVGARIRVRVRAINAGGKSGWAGSASTPKIKSGAAGFKLGPAKKNRKRGIAKLQVTVPDAGTLALARTAKVKGAQRTVAGPMTVKLKVKPRGRAKARLRRRGKAKVRVRVTFTPQVGAPRTKSRRIRVRMT
jgi:hypothetical protein